MISVLFATSLAAAAPPAPAVGDAAVPSASESLRDVEREVRVRLPSLAGQAPTARLLPGRLGVAVDLPVDVASTVDAFEALPAPIRVTVRPIAGGSRATVFHPTRPLRAQLRKSGTSYDLVLGAESQSARLRRLAQIVSRPFPTPKDLGADLELWEEAEAAIGSGELRKARRLWEKLLGARRVEDLAAVRTAELFMISGHVAEAMARLRKVSRRYPRSTGASLARLDLLHLQAVIGEPAPAIEQVDLAAQTVERREFFDYAALRAGLLLAETARPVLAVTRYPEPDTLPEPWRQPARRHIDAAISSALVRPLLDDDAIATVLRYTALAPRMAEHPRRDDLLDLITDALDRTGMWTTSVPLLRERLRSLPGRAEEADAVVRLARAYRATEDRERGNEVIAFGVRRHPDAPGLAGVIGGIAALERAANGLPLARERLAALRDLTDDVALTRALFGIEADLVGAHGTAAELVQVLTLFGRAGYDDAARRDPEMAVALQRAGRHAEAASRLRKLVGRTTNPDERDRLAYHLAQAELALGHDRDALRILELLAKAGTTYGKIAKAQLTERSLEAIVKALESKQRTEAAP